MICEACRGEMQRDVAELDGASGGRRVTIVQAGWYCWQCGAARFTATDLAAAERQLRIGEADGSKADAPAGNAWNAKAA